jgi:predicted nucleic acid-binding protein
MNETKKLTPCCVDASFLVRMLVRQETSDAVEAVWLQWREQERRVVAPALLTFEVTNALYRYVVAGRLGAEKARFALENILSDFDIEIVTSPRLDALALERALEFGLKASYDAHYLAVSELEEAEFWTADARLVRRVEARLPWVRLVGSG